MNIDLNKNKENKMNKYAYSLDEEIYHSKDYVADMIEDSEKDEVDCVYVGEIIEFKHKDFIFATDVLCEAKDRAYDKVSEWCEGYLDAIPKEKLEQLNELILKWFDENVEQPTFFTVKNVKKITVNRFKNGE